MEWTGKAAVDTPVPHKLGTEQQLVRGKKTEPPQHASPITGCEESIRLSKT